MITYGEKLATRGFIQQRNVLADRDWVPRAECWRLPQRKALILRSRLADTCQRGCYESVFSTARVTSFSSWLL